MTVGIDIDGVISYGFCGAHKVLRLFPVFWNYFTSLRIGKFIYLKFRIVNKPVRNFLIALNQTNCQIIIISYMWERHRPVVEKWLQENNIPFNKLVLPEKDEGIYSFKADAIKENKCDLFIDDAPDIIKALTHRVPPTTLLILYYPGADLRELISEKERAP